MDGGRILTPRTSVLPPPPLNNVQFSQDIKLQGDRYLFGTVIVRDGQIHKIKSTQSILVYYFLYEKPGFMQCKSSIYDGLQLL